ncbi:hypothetical protein ACQEVF_59535 [Nonomuraea polychroma]|uniref:hypothetical protein n=1 Tax=Nonomuraea polychroma TaxID=46176 RepID=UPI003D8C0959
MAKTVLLNTRIFAAGADLTSRSNKVEMSCEIEDKDATAFRATDDPEAGWKEVLGGLASTSITGSGQWEAGDPGKVDDMAWTNLSGLTTHPWTVCPLSAAVGDLAYSSSGLITSYKLGEAVGEVAPWEAQAKGSGMLVRGQVAHPPGTARTASGNGTGLNLGALSASQRLFASLHVLSATGTTPSLTVRVESDADDAWASPTTQATFTAATAAGGQSTEVLGAITDTWWRVAWTITGTSPSFLFVASLGIA